MLPLELQNIGMRFCLTLALALPALAASASHAETVTQTIVRADQKSGRLMRTTVAVVSIAVEAVAVQSHYLEFKPDAVAGKPDTALETPADASGLTGLINQIAAEIGVEASLVHSVIRAESNYNARAVSPKGALGLMQLIPATARRFGVTNPFDAKDNIQGGVRYLKFLLEYFRDDYAKAIAAYNAGEAAVDKYHGIPPYAETQNYVYRVAKNLKTAREASQRITAALPLAAALVAGTETYKPIQTSIGGDGRVYYRTP